MVALLVDANLDGHGELLRARLRTDAWRELADALQLQVLHFEDVGLDRMAIADRVALIPLVYGRSMAFVKPWVNGWWEFGKTSSPFADLIVEEGSPRA